MSQDKKWRRSSRKPLSRRKLGKDYEDAVAAILTAFDPGATVTSGTWFEGPDGRRDRDVWFEGMVDGQPRRALIECKDYNIATTGRVGIELVDALDSKRRDLRADFAVLCSNAGFTDPALRKARRVGINLISALNKGDERIRFGVVVEMYTRAIRLQKGTFGLGGVERTLDLFSLNYEGKPMAPWVLSRMLKALILNPVVAGELQLSYEFRSPLMFTHGEERLVANALSIYFEFTGEWRAHTVAIESEAAVYDWVRGRLLRAPVSGEVVIKGLDAAGGTPIEEPSFQDDARQLFLRGELELRNFVFGPRFAEPAEIPELDAKILNNDDYAPTLPKRFSKSSLPLSSASPTSALHLPLRAAPKT
jgi:hypothetical protein